jgi:hypothetical protein
MLQMFIPNYRCRVAHNKSLKLARVARWTAQTGAASQCIAGLFCRLARR